MDAVKLHTVFITHNRLELTKQAIESYLETVTVPHTVAVVDNASEDGTRQFLWEWEEVLQKLGPRLEYHFLPRNRYPGYATNMGWSRAPQDATHLHRADNDFAFLPGWCEEVERIFQSEKVGQVGLRTGEQEPGAPFNVGGNCVIRRELWDAGLRYDERPWPQIRKEVGPGYSEDAFFSPAVERMGYTWTRVSKQCLVSLATGDWKDPYYAESYGLRGIKPRRDDPTLPPDWKGGYSE